MYINNSNNNNNQNNENGKFLVTLNDLIDDMAYENNYYSDMYQERGEIYDKEKEKWNLKGNSGGRYSQKFIHHVMKCEWGKKFTEAYLLAKQKELFNKIKENSGDDESVDLEENKEEAKIRETENKNLKIINKLIQEADEEEENNEIYTDNNIKSKKSKVLNNNKKSENTQLSNERISFENIDEE